VTWRYDQSDERREDGEQHHARFHQRDEFGYAIAFCRQACAETERRASSRAGIRRRDKRAATIARLALVSARELGPAARTGLAQKEGEYERQHDGADPNHVGMFEGRRRQSLAAGEVDQQQTEGGANKALTLNTRSSWHRWRCP